MWTRKIDEQAELDDGDERVALERVRVLVEERRAGEDHQVAGECGSGDEQEEKAGHADEDLRADR